MNPRITKEARQIFWPWAVVTAASAAALVTPWAWQPAWEYSHSAQIAFGLVVLTGFPLLAGLPIGYEFQYHTLPALLAAPVDRRRVWREKFILTLAMVIAPAILCALRAQENHVGLGAAAVATAWIAALAASAMFWTLFAKSTMGGLALNICVQWVILTGWLYLRLKLDMNGLFSPWVEAAAAVLLLGYAVVMVWLGRRTLLRFQAIEGQSECDPLSALSARLVPRQAAEWFRCQPDRLVCNLFLKELQLLRPVWPLAALNLLAWTCLFALGTDPGYHPLHSPDGALIVASLAATFVLSPLIAILAGTLSLGEEKHFGTHGWHLTLPVPAWLQWTVKLGIAVLTGTIFAGALPPLAVAAREWFLGEPLGMRGPTVVWLCPLVFATVTLAAFWLATLTKGTVRAALWVFPALFLFGATYSLGYESGYKFAAWAQTFTDHMLLWLDPFRLRLLPFPSFPRWWPWSPTFMPVILLIFASAAPVGAFILVQTYRKFRGRAEDTDWYLARNLLTAASVVFACGIALGDFGGLIQRSQRQVVDFLRETNAAIVKLEAGTAFQAGAPPLRLTAAELERAVPMSDATRHWLGNGTVTVSPAPPDWKATEKFLGRNRFGYSSQRAAAEQPFLSYVASVRLSNGLTCRMFYRYESHTLPQRAGVTLEMAGCE